MIDVLRLLPESRGEILLVLGEALFEFRVCSVKPGAMDAYLAACASHAGTRARLEPGFLGAFRTSVGGDVNEITRVIAHADYDARDAAKERTNDRSRRRRREGR